MPVNIPAELVQLEERKIQALDAIYGVLKDIHEALVSNPGPATLGGNDHSPMTQRPPAMPPVPDLVKDKIETLIEISERRRLPYQQMGGRWVFDNQAISEYERMKDIEEIERGG